MNKGILWIKLDEESRKRLLELVGTKYQEIYCDHVTLLYNVQVDEYAGLMGKNQEVTVEENCWNDRIQAVTVKIDENLPIKNKKPHITISAKDGVPPVESNKMLMRHHNHEMLKTGQKLKGVIEFYQWAAGGQK